MNLVDTSGWIEFFFAGKNAEFFEEAISDVDKLIVPVVCFYEVFKKVNQVADEARALKAIAQMKQGHVVNLTENIALKASLISIKYKLPMADSFIYSTALSRNAVIWTQDEHFKDLASVKFIKKQ